MSRLRIIYAILLVMILVTVVPTIISNLLLTRILRDELETQERKYQTRTVVTLAEEVRNHITRYRQQIDKIADAVSMGAEANPTADIFQYMATSGRVGKYYDEDKLYKTILILDSTGKMVGLKLPSLPASARA